MEANRIVMSQSGGLRALFDVLSMKNNCFFSFDWSKKINFELSFDENYFSDKYNVQICGEENGINDKILLLLNTNKTIFFFIEKRSNDIVELRLSCADKSQLEEIKDGIISHIKPSKLTDNTVNIACWYQTQHGPTCINKNIECPPADNSIYNNYSQNTREKLQKLVDSELPSGGKLIVFHGLPGGGKTWFIRYLINKWKTKATYHYVTDPENFFTNVGYLFQVINYDNNNMPAPYGERSDVNVSQFQKWNIIILEDAGSYIELEEDKAYVNVSLNKLLNITDGLLGQGLKLLLIITTNKEDHKLNPAILRQGRCFANITFNPFSVFEARNWLKEHNVTDFNINDKQLLLAYLYQILEPEKSTITTSTINKSMGFK